MHGILTSTYVANDAEVNGVAKAASVCNICNASLDIMDAPMAINIEAVTGETKYVNADPLGKTTSVCVYEAGKKGYPETGSIAPNAEGKFIISGWGGVIGNMTGTAYKIVDATTGEELTGWTAGTSTPNVGESGVVREVQASLGKNAQGYRFSITADLSDAALAGKTVNVIFAFVAADGVDGDVYVPCAKAMNIVIPSAS